MSYRDDISKSPTGTILEINSSQISAKRDTSTLARKKITLYAQLSYFLTQIIKKPRWILVFLIGRFSIVRRMHKLIFNLPKKRQPITKFKSSLFTDLNTQEAIESLNRDGIFLDISLPDNILQDILDHANSNNCHLGGKTDLGFNIIDKKKAELACKKPFFVAKYFNVSRFCPSILELANDPKILEIANGYIGKCAKYTGASLYWTFPIESVPYDSEQLGFCQYHYDLDDYASIRFSFYLTEVSLESGPHICILGSHRKRSILHELNYFSRRPPEKELEELYGQQQYISLTGKPGMGFIEDTFCFHRGSVPKSSPRLFLQLHFAANNYNFVEHHDYKDLETLRCFC